MEPVFTVIGFYEDTQQVYINFVSAHSVQEAYKVAAKGKYGTLKLVAAIRGRCEPESQNESFVPASDYV